MKYKAQLIVVVFLLVLCHSVCRDAERQRKTRLLMSELQDQQHQAKLEKRGNKKR